MKGRHNKITSLAQNLIVCMLLRRKVINFIKSYQSIRHCLHAHVQIHEVLIVTSRMIHTHFRLQAEQKAVAVTCKTTKLINKHKKVLLLDNNNYNSNNNNSNSNNYNNCNDGLSYSSSKWLSFLQNKIIIADI